MRHHILTSKETFEVTCPKQCAQFFRQAYFEKKTQRRAKFKFSKTEINLKKSKFQNVCVWGGGIFIPFKERFLGGMSFANVVIICYPILLLNREGVKKRRGKKPYFFLLFLPLPSSWYSFYLHSIIWPLYDNSGSPTHPTVTFKSVGEPD